MISSFPNVLHNLQIEQQIALLGCEACGTRLICRMCNAICSLQIERLCCAIYLQIPVIGILTGILTTLKKASACSQALSFAVLLRFLSLIPLQESRTCSAHFLRQYLYWKKDFCSLLNWLLTILKPPRYNYQKQATTTWGDGLD